MRKLHLETVGTLLLGFMFLGSPEPAGAQGTPTLGRSAESLSAADKGFIKEAAAAGIGEVELGQLAKEKGQTDEVRRFGQHMIDDHGKANGELVALAARKGLTVSMELDAKHKALKDKLAKLVGLEFDKQYAREMVKGHEKVIAAFEKESAQGKDAALVSWTKQILPTLQGHLTMARETEDKVKNLPPKPPGS